MNTPNWIEEKAEQYANKEYDEWIEHNKNTASRNGYIAGATEVYKELEKYMILLDEMYNVMIHLPISRDMVRNEKVMKGLEIAEQYEQLKALNNEQ